MFMNFSEPIPSRDEIWIFGDDFLDHTQGWLKKLAQNNRESENYPSLYIHDRYNIKTYPIPRDEKFLSGIQNQIANTVMRKILLPSAMLIVMNNNMLEDAVFTIECMEGLI